MKDEEKQTLAERIASVTQKSALKLKKYYPDDPSQREYQGSLEIRLWVPKTSGRKETPTIEALRVLGEKIRWETQLCWEPTQEPYFEIQYDTENWRRPQKATVVIKFSTLIPDVLAFIKETKGSETEIMIQGIQGVLAPIPRKR